MAVPPPIVSFNEVLRARGGSELLPKDAPPPKPIESPLHQDYERKNGVDVDRFWKAIRNRTGVEYRWREDCPPNRALIAVYQGVMQDLYHIGKDFEWALDDYGEPLSEYIPFEELADGVYVWEGSIDSHGCTDYYGESEFEVEFNGEFRPATKEEWACYVREEYPWDIGLWLSEYEPELPPDSPPD